MTELPIVNGALGTILKGYIKGLDNLEIRVKVETIKTTTLLRPVRILRRVLETWRDLLSLKLSKKPSANAGVKKTQWSKMIIILSKQSYLQVSILNIIYLHSYMISSIPI